MRKRKMNVTIVVLRDETGFDGGKRAAAERGIASLAPDCVEFVGGRSYQMAFGRRAATAESPGLRLRRFVSDDPRFADARVGCASGECVASVDFRGRVRSVPLGATACRAIERTVL